MNLKLYTDGGSRGNPGPAAYGFVVYGDLPAKATGSRNGQIGSLRETAVASEGAGIILEKRGNYLGTTTNNIAEYEGLIAGLTWIVDNHPDAKVDIFMDSLLIVNQIKGLYKVKNAALQTKHHQARALANKLSGFTITHVLRGKNAEADALVNDCLDAQLS